MNEIKYWLKPTTSALPIELKGIKTLSGAKTATHGICGTLTETSAHVIKILAGTDYATAHLVATKKGGIWSAPE